MGSYAGLVVSSIFGCTLVFTVPVGMGLIQRDDRPFFARGVMLGLATMPAGLVVGGLLCGLTVLECLWQNLPVFLLAALLFVGLPMAELLHRILTRPFAWLGERLGMKPQSLTGMLVGLVSALPTLSMYKDMDERGKVAAGAFLVSGTSLLAAHMAFTLSAEPDMLLPVICAKLSGAVTAVVLAVCAGGAAKKNISE